MDSTFYLVVGLGKTGLSIARYLNRRHKPFVVFDTRKEPVGIKEFKQEFPDIEVFLETFPDALYPRLNAIINSPGVSLDEPFIKKARAHHIPIFGDIECLAREINKPVIAITGTNGKSTVTTLVGEMAKAANLRVAVAGNIGAPVLDLLDDENDYDLWVLELSSFQLELLHSLAPIAATILNITPDHLDRHHHIEAYISAKQRIYHCAKTCLYNRDDPQTSPQQDGQIISFGLDTPRSGQWGLIQDEQGTYLAFGDMKLLSVNELRLKGTHNWANALAACALAHAAGISFNAIVSVLKQFAGLAHRTQWVRTIDGVDWINDSKGTNVGATISALCGIGGATQGKIVLIAGGQGKGADFATLRAPVLDYARLVVLIGEDANKIEHALLDSVPLCRANDLEEAIMLAKAQSKPGDVVLLSPACASFDMFRDFNHRGEMFTTLVHAIP